MADPNYYHQTDPDRQSQPPFPQGFPPGSAPPQAGPYPNAPPNQQWTGQAPQPGYQPGYPNQSIAHNAGPQQMFPATDPTIAGLTAQMGGLGMAVDAGARGHKKKHRHAFHDIGVGPAASAQDLNNAMGGVPPAPQFLNTGLNQAPQYAEPPTNMPHAAQYGQTIATQPGLSTGADSVATQGRVDPEQIPSVPRSRDIPAQFYSKNVYPTMEKHLPPPSAITFTAQDQGNSSPKYARLTINNIPSTSDFLSSTGLPLGMILQPLAPLEPGEQPIPVLDFGEVGPPRCRRCRTYINPFMSFKSGGNKFVCNMCTFANDTPPEYYSPVDPSGGRLDRMQRPELMMGTVEFLVPKEYWNKERIL